LRQPADEPDSVTWSERRVETAGIVRSVSYGRLVDVCGGDFFDSNRRPEFSATIFCSQAASRITLSLALTNFPKGEEL